MKKKKNPKSFFFIRQEHNDIKKENMWFLNYTLLLCQVLLYYWKEGKIHKNWEDIKPDPVNPSESTLTENTANNNNTLDSTQVKSNKQCLQAPTS